jgi:cysteine synthase A
LSATRRSSPQARVEETGCEILGKCEFLNPGGSVKDRAGRGDRHRRERAACSGPAG